MDQAILVTRLRDHKVGLISQDKTDELHCKKATQSL